LVPMNDELLKALTANLREAVMARAEEKDPIKRHDLAFRVALEADLLIDVLDGMLPEQSEVDRALLGARLVGMVP
jgi:hypothetical protein